MFLDIIFMLFPVRKQRGNAAWLSELKNFPVCGLDLTDQPLELKYFR